MSESYSEDIMRAVALSVQSATQSPAIAPALSVDNDDDEARFQADLARAIALSKANPSPATSVSSDLSPIIDSESAVPSSNVPLQSSFLTERAELEQQRLARLKRFHGEEDSPNTGPSSKRQTQPRETSCALAPLDAGTSRKGRKAVAEEAEIFLDGELRQTANQHVELGHNGEDGRSVFRLSQIIGDKSQIELAIISTYALQLSWIYTFFAPETPVVLVTQPGPSENRNVTVKEILPNWIRVTPFLRGGRGVMHMKFFLLFYRTGRLRVIVSTANLMDHDWRDIENTVWVQDVPRRPTPITHEPRADDFPSTLEYVLHAINVAPAIASLLSTGHSNIPLSTVRPGVLRTRWNFSRVRVKLIPSIAGKHEGWPAILKSGHTALMRAVNLLNPQQRTVSLEYQGSSIGTYSAAWISEFILSGKGISPETILDAPKSLRATTPMPSPNTLKILFPTRNWVRNSVLGESGGGTMFCRRRSWEAAKFPRNLFYESRSRRGRVLMHSKMIIATFLGAAPSPNEVQGSQADPNSAEVKKDDGDIVGYAYIGSHNFTPSAWGTLSGSGFTPILNVTNYELGIVLPLRDEADIDQIACFERPPRRYSPKDLPWMQEESDVLNGL